MDDAEHARFLDLEAYQQFLEKGAVKDDPLEPLGAIHSFFMTYICKALPEEAISIGTSIDLLVGFVSLGHLRATLADPEGARRAEQLISRRLLEKGIQFGAIQKKS